MSDLLAQVTLPLGALVEAFVVLLVAIAAGQLLAVVAAAATRRFASPGWEVLIRRMVSWGLAGLGVANALQVLGVDLSVLLGAAGFATVAIGFAAQTSMSNFISGLFLMLESAVRVGDFLEVGGVTGEVVAIDPLSVRLRTFDNRMVRIPNETLVKSNLTNLSAFPIRRIDLVLTVFQEDDLALARSVLVGLGELDPQVLKEPAPNVQVQAIEVGVARIQASYWATQETWILVRTRLVTQIPRVLEEAGVRLGQGRIHVDADGELHAPSSRSISR